MNSKTIALILGPSLAIILLLAGYWVKTRSQEAGVPLELHAGLQTPGAVISPPPPSAETGSPKEAAPESSSSTHVIVAPSIEAPLAPEPPAATLALVPAPKFDVVRVEPTGETVVAGHTEPDTHVAVVANGKIIAEGKSDAAGQFVLLPPPLPPGDHALTLQASPPSGPAVVSDQNVAVSVPVKGNGEVIVALAEPGKATVLLADPTAKVDPSKTTPPKTETPPAMVAKEDSQQNAVAAKSAVSIKTAEIVEPGGFFVSGFATPGAHIRLYLNGSAFADVTAAADGAWTVKVNKGLVPGHYAVRADQVDGLGAVLARAEVPFDYARAIKTEAAAALAVGSKSDQTQRANASGVNTPNAGPSQPPAGATVVAEIQTATVERGNSLWRISRLTLGHGMRYTEIYAANSGQIRDPKLIYPGQVFVIPGQSN